MTEDGVGVVDVGVVLALEVLQGLAAGGPRWWRGRRGRRRDDGVGDDGDRDAAEERAVTGVPAAAVGVLAGEDEVI